MAVEGRALDTSEVHWKEGTGLTRLTLLQPYGQQQPQAFTYQNSLPKGTEGKKNNNNPFETIQGKESLPLSNFLR